MVTYLLTCCNIVHRNVLQQRVRYAEYNKQACSRRCDNLQMVMAVFIGLEATQQKLVLHNYHHVKR